MLKKMTGLQQLFLLTFLIAIITFAIAYYSYGLYTSILFSIFIITVLNITRDIWLVHKTSKNKIRIASLTIVLATASSFSLWQDIVSTYIPSVIEKIIGIKIANSSDKYFPYAILLFVLIAVFIINYFSRDESAMGKHPDSVKDDIPDRNYQEKLKTVRDAIRGELRSIDLKSNWSNQYFVPLDAEVEIFSKSTSTRKINDLLDAVKKSNDRLFLILGDPGAGKSVAIRQLCIDLLKESDKTGKLPIYINLKEWQPNYTWTIDRKPDLDELKEFVLKYLRNIDIITSKFFDKYFDALYDSGRLFFIFDSFDEIPAVLNEYEYSELMNYISELFFKFLKGARGEISQGVLASRNFRKPTKLFQVNTILQIVPLTEKKIIKFFKLRIDNSESIIKTIFKDRQDLVVVLKNPFLSSLLIEYLEKNENSLPEDQFSMYSSYIRNTIYDAKDRLKEYTLSETEVIDYSINIAKEMFRINSLEISVNELVIKYKDTHFTNVAEILKFTKIGRFNNSNLFSFSHRRFAEFFYAFGLDDSNITLESIPNDSQERDALVLFCQIAKEEIATSVATYCYSIIEKNDDLKNPRTLHSLRFLYDAYIGRKECIKDFQDKLYDIINNQVRNDNSILNVKIALEFVGLLSDEKVDSIINQALIIGNYWTNETAIKSCRHLGNISNSLENNLIDYVSSIELKEIVHSKFRDLYFSLSLSDAFRNVKKVLYLRGVDFLITFFILYVPLAVILVIILITIKQKQILQYDALAYALNTIFVISFIYFSNFFTVLALYSKARYKRVKDIVSVLFPLLILLAVVFLLSKYQIPGLDSFLLFFKHILSYFSFLIKPIGYLLTIFITLGIINRIYQVLSDTYNYFNFEIKNSMSRITIYNYYISLKSNFFKNLLINSIERKVEKASEEWPDKTFLKMTSNQRKVRLSILDEKWLGYKK